MLVRPIEKTKQMWKNAGEREKVQEYGLWAINWRAGWSLVFFVYDGCMWPVWLSRNASYWKRTAKPLDVLFTWMIPCAVYLEFVDTFSSDDSLLIFARSWAFTAHLTFLTRITTPTWPVRKRVGDGGAWLVIQFVGRKGMERKFKLT
jgi:hypothetical protein